MKGTLTGLQIANVIGLTNLIQIAMIQGRLAPIVTRVSFIFSCSLLIGSTLAILLLGVSFIKKCETNSEKYSSSLSPFFKFILPNSGIACVLVLLTLGLIYDHEILKVCLLSVVLFTYPVLIYVSSGFVVVSAGDVRLYDYSDSFTRIEASRIRKVKSSLFGFIYKIEYVSVEGSIKGAYFFPKGISLPFIEPDSIKVLKSMIVK